MAAIPIPETHSSNHLGDQVSCSPALASSAYQTLKNDEVNGVPLNTPWTFWIDKATRGLSAAEYEANVKEIYTVSTAESFWSVYNNIPSIRQISTTCAYHLMRDRRRPIWEDECNQKGGTWRIKLDKQSSILVWREILLAAIGEQFEDSLDHGDEVCGVSISIRERDDLLQVWNCNSNITDPSRMLEKIQSLVPDVNFLAQFYKAHKRTENEKGGERSRFGGSMYYNP